MITVFIDGYYEVSGVCGLWEEQNPGLWVLRSNHGDRQPPRQGLCNMNSFA